MKLMKLVVSLLLLSCLAAAGATGRKISDYTETLTPQDGWYFEIAVPGVTNYRVGFGTIVTGVVARVPAGGGGGGGTSNAVENLNGRGTNTTFIGKTGTATNAFQVLSTNGTPVVLVTSNNLLVLSVHRIATASEDAGNFSFGYDNHSLITSGTANNAFGASVQKNLTSGGFNNGFGYQAQTNLTTGSWNAGFGWRSQFSATTADDNSAFGHSTQGLLTSGLQNNAFGVSAQSGLTTGSFNGAFGFRSQFSVGGALGNNGFGFESQYYTTGNYNNAFGYRAQHTLNSGTMNNGFGMNSQWRMTSGSYNNAFGGESQANLTTGAGNVSMGNEALNTLVSGDVNVAVGTSALYSLPGAASRSVGIGPYAGYHETASDRLYIDNVNRGSLAVGRTNSLIYGVFDPEPINQRLNISAAVSVGGSVTIGSNVPTPYLYIEGTGASHKKFGIAESSGIVYIQGDIEGNLRTLMTIDQATGNMGLGTIAPSSSLDVTGQVRAASAIITNMPGTGDHVAVNAFGLLMRTNITGGSLSSTNADIYISLELFGHHLVSSNLWVTGTISGASLSVVDFYANNLILTNALGSNQVRLGHQDLTNYSYNPFIIAGVGGANTNFTLQAGQPEVIINAFTNVSLRHIIGTSATKIDYIRVTMTNGSGTDRTLEFSPATNSFRFAGVYGTNAPSVVTNLTQLHATFRVSGVNVLVSYDYYPWP